MLIARWRIDARFGHKQTVIDMLHAWARDIAPQIGFKQGRLLSGSIGVAEAAVEHDWEIADLAELDRAWAKLATIEAHAAWGRDLEPHVVSGSANWTIFRVVGG
jgi:hypothetical protein